MRRISNKDPAGMSAAAINKEMLALDQLSSENTQAFIAAGRGHERPSEYLKLNDELSTRARALFDRRAALVYEIERRAGPGMRTLPRGFGPMKNPRRAKKHDLTAVAIEGYENPDSNAVKPNPHLYSSPNWFAFEIGKYFQRTGRPRPHDVRMGRGYQIHVGDMLYAFDSHNAIVRVNPRRAVHTKKFDRCVTDVKKRGGKVNPYAVCMATLGERRAVKKSHRRNPSRKRRAKGGYIVLSRVGRKTFYYSRDNLFSTSESAARQFRSVKDATKVARAVAMMLPPSTYIAVHRS